MLTFFPLARYTPLVENLRLQVRMNIKSKAVELRTSRSTVETGAIQKGEDFVRAYAMGFDVEDAVAILRLDGVCGCGCGGGADLAVCSVQCGGNHLC